MPKDRSSAAFICSECGNESQKWAGFCHVCDARNTLVEIPKHLNSSARTKNFGLQDSPELLGDQSPDTFQQRQPMNFAGLNQVLGGGLVPGSTILVAGEPGIGKSTLLLQISQGLRATVLYVSGEESKQQVELRYERLGIQQASVYFLAETGLELILQNLEHFKPNLLIVDSIQTIESEVVSSSAGTVNQIRECASLLSHWAKKNNVVLLMTGHVTKDGNIAGPKVLEHMVDVVLYIEGDPLGGMRFIRCTKNRFGSTEEVAVLEMGQAGLKEVTDPSRLTLENLSDSFPGSALTIVLHGSRPLLTEIQTLVTSTSAAPPRRTVNGIDFNRLILITAVLGKKGKLPLSNQDIVASVVGGIKISEPAADLALSMAIASSYYDIAVDYTCLFLGEIGLTGELRSVPQIDRRISEGVKLGFKKVIIPAKQKSATVTVEGIDILYAATIRDALELTLNARTSV
jgi:DNA repair protein RadA/Sms